MLPSRTLTLSSYCEEGLPSASNFTIVDTVVDSTNLPEGCLLLRALYFSADPYLRMAVRSGRPSSVQLNQPMSGFISGRVESSTIEGWTKGDLFGGALPFSTLQIVTSTSLKKTAFWKLTDVITEDELSYGIGALGMPGATAWGGLVDVLRPLKDETLLITAASGAVGQLVGQIAKARGCRVIGTAGGPVKCALLLDKFGFDVAIDHKAATTPADLEKAIREAAPKGLSMVFENVGTTTFECAFRCLGVGGRIAVCGAIAAYNEKKPILCTIDPSAMIYTAQRIEGFVSTPWLTGQRGGGEWLREISSGIKNGTIKIQETRFDGIEKWPEAFASLFTGANIGKVVVCV